VELWTLRPVPDPLGSYLRPSSRDHKFLLQMLVEGKPVGTGLVADPCLAERQRDLLAEAHRQGVETVLDPRTVDLSTIGGFTRSGVTDLPWAGAAPHTPSDLTGAAGALTVRQLVSFVEAGGHSAVLAPTHYLQGPADPWVGVDAELTRGLRRELDGRGLPKVLIYYPLVIRASVLRNPEQRDQLIAGLAGLPVDALWLRVHPFGTTTSGPLALRRYLQMCRALHALGVPLVAEHSGTIGSPSWRSARPAASNRESPQSTASTSTATSRPPSPTPSPSRPRRGCTCTSSARSWTPRRQPSSSPPAG